MTPIEKSLSKLSENHKINVIRGTELKLWPFKDDLFNVMTVIKLLVKLT